MCTMNIHEYPIDKWKIIMISPKQFSQDFPTTPPAAEQLVVPPHHAPRARGRGGGERSCCCVADAPGDEARGTWGDGENDGKGI